MAFDKVIDSAKLDADITTVANAIREKAGTSGKLAFPNGMADAVRNIQSGVELPELDNPGSSGDVVEGKQLIDANGNKITGTVKNGNRYFYSYNGGVNAHPEDGALAFDHTFTGDCYYRTGDVIQLFHSDLGDATAKDVAQGKTFTTAEGLKVPGTLPTPNGETVEADMVEYIDDTTFYVEGAVGEDVLLRKGKFMGAYVDTSKVGDFGTATPADVARGKTFTSSEGYALLGTMEAESGGVQMRVEGETLYITGDVTVENGTLIL